METKTPVKKKQPQKKPSQKKRGKIVGDGDSVYRAPYVDLLSERMALALGKKKRQFTNFSIAYFCSALAVYSRELIANAKKVKADENDNDLDDDRISAHTVFVAQQNMFRSSVPLAWEDPSILDAYETDDEEDEEDDDEKKEGGSQDEEEEEEEKEEEEEEEKEKEDEEGNDKDKAVYNTNTFTTDRLNAIIREVCSPTNVLHLLPFVESENDMDE
jgi:hypothetical protein